ncbi:MAG: HDIG domain-containing protein [Simkaniaceae bacterium]
MPDYNKKGWKSLFHDKSFLLRLFIGTILFCVLGLFLHFREVRIESLDLDSVAKHYIVAQVDFEFPDEAATLIRKQEAIKDISTVYALEEKNIKDLRGQLRQRIAQDETWRRQAPTTTSEEMNLAADAFEENLIQARFTDERTLKKMQELQIPTGNYFLFTPKQTTTRLPVNFWNEMRQRVRKETSVDDAALNYLVNFLENADWKLEKDTSAQRDIMQQIESGVPTKYTKVKAGNRIISQGERVTSRHISMLQAMKRALAEQRSLFQPVTLLGSFILAFFILLFGTIYLKVFEEEFYKSLRLLALFASTVIFLLILSKGMEYLLVEYTKKLQEAVRYPIFVPFAGILLCVLIRPSVAFFATALLTILMGMSLAVEHDRFLMMNIITGIIAILSSQHLRKRKQVFTVAGKVWLSSIPVLVGFHLMEDNLWNVGFGMDLLTTLGFMLLITILVIGLLPILESLFHIMTDMTLMEYMDPNNELLRRLSLEAPGTYQHCLVVGTLAEAAASAIGANGLLCRVSTLYHDIGKLFNPHYFTENQMGGFNIHQLLTPLESTQVIMAHVVEGEALARKHKLPQSFIDIIREHHGTTLVYYFYAKQVELMGGDVDAVDESKFRYPGPKPKSKESAIIMIADTVEAASRSMDEITKESLTEMVERLVNDKIDEGQFDECKLTFEELGIIKRTIINALVVTRHLRVKYPEKVLK